MTEIFAVMLGCGLGGALRHWISEWLNGRSGDTLPWGTLSVNVSGALAIGLLAASMEAVPASVLGVRPWQFLAIGFLGSYTTVSSFMLQTLGFARSGSRRAAAGHVALALALCLVAATMGYAFGAALGGA